MVLRHESAVKDAPDKKLPDKKSSKPVRALVTVSDKTLRKQLAAYLLFRVLIKAGKHAAV